jgi:hypothetical protein
LRTVPTSFPSFVWSTSVSSACIFGQQLSGICSVYICSPCLYHFIPHVPYGCYIVPY